jgi:hypothetical protein
MIGRRAARAATELRSRVAQHDVVAAVDRRMSSTRRPCVRAGWNGFRRPARAVPPALVRPGGVIARLHQELLRYGHQVLALIEPNGSWWQRGRPSAAARRDQPPTIRPTSVRGGPLALRLDRHRAIREAGVAGLRPG